MSSPEQLQRFVFDALRHLDVPIARMADDRWAISVPPRYQSSLEGQERLSLTFDKETFQRADETDLEFVTPGSPVLSWIIDELRGLGSVFCGEMPWSDAQASACVQTLTSAYQVTGGSVSIHAATWKPALVFQFHYLLRLHGVESRDRLVHVTVDDRAVVMSEDEIRVLSAAPLSESSTRPTLTPDQLGPAMEAAAKTVAVIRDERERELARRLSGKRESEEKQLRDYFGTMRLEVEGLREVVSSREQRASIQEQLDDIDRQLAQRLEEVRARYAVSTETQLAGVLVIGVKRLEGKVVLQANEPAAHIPFSLPCFRSVAPPFPCAKTGRLVYRLAATADGRFVDADVVTVCQHSGRVMPRDEMTVCAVSGKTYCPEFIAECPVLLRPVYRGEFVECPGCRQSVSRAAMKDASCRSCAERGPVDRTDTRIQRVIAKYPTLASWSKWAMSETRDIYNFELLRTLHQARLVLRKCDLAPIRAQKRSRIMGAWRDVEPQEVMGGT